MEIIAFCGPQSDSELMKFLNRHIASKTLIIEGEIMLLAREATETESTGLIGYLSHCDGLPEEEPNVEPFLEKAGLSYHGVQLLRYGSSQKDLNKSSFDWDRFYSFRHGYSFLEHLRDQFEKLGFEYVLINVGMVKAEDSWCHVAIAQLANTIYWLNDEAAEDYKLALAAMKQDGIACRITKFFY